METYTTDEALALMGFGKFQAFFLVYAGMGLAGESMELMLLSFVGPLVREEWKISASDESLLSSVLFAGMLIGCCAWGFVSDKYGRRTSLLCSTLFTSGVGFLSALSPNYFCLVALRFLVGIGVGGFHVFTSWFLEFVPAHNRGTWAVLFSVFWTVGTIMEASLAWAVIPALSWRWLLALTALPRTLLIPFFGIAPESPRFLCAQDRISDARLILERIAMANKSALPPGVLTYHLEAEVEHNSITYETEHLLPIKPGGSIIAAVRRLLSPKLLRLTLLLWLVYYANAFAYYGVILLTSQLSDANTRCISGLKNVVQNNGTNLYKDTFVTTLAEIPGVVISAVFVEWFGRKASMWFMLFTCCAFLGPLVLQQNEVVTIVLLFGARAFSLGSITILSLYAPEAYPTIVRSTGVGIATAIGRIGGIVCPFVAVSMLGSCYQTEAILVFELVLVLAGVACFLLPIETIGCEMD